MNLMGTYYEGIGVLVELGFLNLNHVNTLLGHHITQYWETIRPFTLEHRERIQRKPYDHLEYLYNELKNLEQTVTP